MSEDLGLPATISLGTLVKYLREHKVSEYDRRPIVIRIFKPEPDLELGLEGDEEVLTIPKPQWVDLVWEPDDLSDFLPHPAHPEQPQVAYILASQDNPYTGEVWHG